MNDLEQWRKELQQYYNLKYFMESPNNWQELANAAVERDYLAEVLKRKEHELSKLKAKLKAKEESVKLQEINVTAKKSPTYTTVFTPEWSILDVKDSNSATKEELEASKYLTNYVRNKMNDAGNAIGLTAIEIGPSFTPLWFVLPAVKAGLSASEGNYKEAAKEAAIGLLAPFAIGKGVLYGIKGRNIVSNIAAVTNKRTILNRLRHPILASKYGEVVSNYRLALGENMFKVAKPHLSEVKLYTKGEMPGYMPKLGEQIPYIEGLSKRVRGDDMWTIAHEVGHAWDEGVGALYSPYRDIPLAQGPYYHNLKVPNEYTYGGDVIDVQLPRMRENEFTADVLASKFYEPKYADPGDGTNLFLSRYNLAKKVKEPVYNTSGPVYSVNTNFKDILKAESDLFESLLKQYRDLFRKWVEETNGELPYNIFKTKSDIQALNHKRQLLDLRFYERAKGINPRAYYSLNSNGELELHLFKNGGRLNYLKFFK